MSNFQTPPTLVFPSKERLESVISTITAAISSADIVEIHPYYPQNNFGQTRQRAAKACGPCHKRHVKCHVRSEDITCTRATCGCLFHTAAVSSAMEEGSPSPPAFSYHKEVPSTIGIRRPGLLCTRHFAGETSFCPYIPKRNQPKLLVPELPITFPTSFPLPPSLSPRDQHRLIEVYYENMSPYFPFINKSILYEQLALFMQNQPCYLSPLFFYALFSRAAHIEGNATTEDGRIFEQVGEQFMEYALVLRSCYQTQSSISTVLALVIMANQLEQTKCYNAITRSWILAGEAFRMVVDIGIHRMGSLNEFEMEDQLCIRSFWLAYITDATISLSYGRPSAVEEKILDVVTPRTLDTDDDIIKDWVKALSEILTLSKISVRIVRFNYSPPPIFQLEGPVKRHNAFLASMDSWLTDLRYPVGEQETEDSEQLTEVKERLKFQKEIFFLTDLILLHRPYIDDIVSDRSHPSLDICSHAATAIIYHSYKLGEAGILYHAILPMLAYSLVIALRIQIMNAANTSNSIKYNSNKVCELGLDILAKLPQTKSEESILSDALEDLRNHFHNRQAPPVFEDEVVYIAQRVPTQYKPADQIIFGGSSPASSPGSGVSNNGKTNNDLRVIHCGPPSRVDRREPSRNNRSSRSTKTHHGLHYKGSNSQRRKSVSGFRKESRRESASSSSQQRSPLVSNSATPPLNEDSMQVANPNFSNLYNPSIPFPYHTQPNQFLTEEDHAVLQSLSYLPHYNMHHNEGVNTITHNLQNASMNDSLIQDPIMNQRVNEVPLSNVFDLLCFYFPTVQELMDYEVEREMIFNQNDFIPQSSQQPPSPPAP
ncbi:hypothetical protein K501DRAFT_328385 [Backusella circina FSU 941]|nr:hypothetical protein K501DRAFT_328385 [Backusella circina FSU 941]